MRFGARMRPAIGLCTAGTGAATSTRAPQPATPATTHRDRRRMSWSATPAALAHAAAVEPSEPDW